MNNSQSRTLVFSFDGTGNEPKDAVGFRQDESVSNVLKLHVLMGGGLEEDRSETNTGKGEPQKTFYYNGIGTREDGETIPLIGELVTRSRKLINSMLGVCAVGRLAPRKTGDVLPKVQPGMPDGISGNGRFQIPASARFSIVRVRVLSRFPGINPPVAFASA